MLDAHFQKSGEEVYVASLSAIQNSTTGEIKSYCGWIEGIESLLPKADLVYFFRPGSNGDPAIVATAAWDAVEMELDRLLEPLEIYPPRYRVRSFPTPEELRQFDLWTDPSE
jgi:hypothetical protein